jgi:hypothetical protein
VKEKDITMSYNDDMNPCRPPEAELINPRYVEKQPLAFEAATSITAVMFGAFVVCLFYGVYTNLQWVHHICFLSFLLCGIICWRKRRSWWYFIPIAVSIGLWAVLDAITYAPIGN